MPASPSPIIKKKPRGRPANLNNKKLKKPASNHTDTVPITVPIAIPSNSSTQHEFLNPYPQLPDFTTFESLNWEFPDMFADHSKDSNPVDTHFVNW